MDVLGDAELRDPALGRGLAIALGVGGGEVARGGVPGVVGAQVDVVVGQHRVRRISSASRRSCGVVTLKFAAERLDHAHGAARALDQPRVVGRGREHRVVDVERALERLAAERLRRLHGPQARAVERGGRPRRRVGLLDRVGHRGRRRSRSRRRASASSARVEQRRRARAGARRRGRRPRSAGGAAASAARTDAERVAPPRDADAARRAPRAPSGSATTTWSIPAAWSAASDQSSIVRPATSTSALGRPWPEALAAARGDEECDGPRRTSGDARASGPWGCAYSRQRAAAASCSAVRERRSSR